MGNSNKAWDTLFGKAGRIFEKPHEDLPGIASLLKKLGVQKILDLGSGSGRHLVFLAKNGFSVFGMDNSPAGIELSNRWLASEGLVAELTLHEMASELPYPDSFFDAVISIQVIHHARTESIRKTIRETERVLKKGGFVFFTVPRQRNQGKEFEQIEPGTFVPLDGPEQGLPHHYFTTEEFAQFFGGFRISDVHLDSLDHYCLSGFKL
jgi:SAM-dependent methyltransferase